MIATLQEEFVCSWLLAKDLEAIAERAADPDLTELGRKVRANYGYPVDSVLLSADLEVVGHVNVNQPAATAPDGYLAFLRRGLAKAGRELAIAPASARAPATAARSGATHRGPVSLPSVVLTREAPSASVLDLFRRGGIGEFSMKFLSIDSAAFAEGGTLELEVSIDSGSADGRFQICIETPDVPGAMAPARELEVAAGTTGRVEYVFAKGVRLGLAVHPGTNANEGDMNAFLATLTVRER